MSKCEHCGAPEPKHNLTEKEFEAITRLAAVSGATAVFMTRLAHVDKEELERLEKAFPDIVELISLLLNMLNDATNPQQLQESLTVARKMRGVDGLFNRMYGQSPN